MAAIGSVDEANAAIGLLRLVTAGLPDVDGMLSRIQNDLFDVGADLCVPGTGGNRLRLTDVPVARLEADVAIMNGDLPALTSFILPAGSPGASHAHMARTIVRRAERTVVALDREEAVNPALIRYLNRLSDNLFVLARMLNGKGANDVLWVPGGRSGDAQQ